MVDTDRLIAIDDVLALTQIGRTHLYRLIGSGLFPKPRKLGRSSRWSARAINAWIAQKHQDEVEA